MLGCLDACFVCFWGTFLHGTLYQNVICESAHSGSPYRIDTTDFAGKIREYNQRPPFNFPLGRGLFEKFFKIHISIYAAHLYDSVMLYARALDTVIRGKAADIAAGRTDIHRLARDGQRITKAIIDKGDYESISGVRHQHRLIGFSIKFR